MPNSIPDTIDHIKKVQKRLEQVIRNLEQRATDHDGSKLMEPERSILDTKSAVLGSLTYGSPEYYAALASVDMQPFLEHHYANNDHHPQFYKDGIAGMSLMSIIEMLADWAAASERVKAGSIAQSLDENEQRFGIDMQLMAVIRNTVEELGW